MKDSKNSVEYMPAINKSIDLEDDSGSLLDITDKTDIYVEYEKNKNLYLSSGSILTSNRAMIQNQRIKLKERSKDISEAQYARLKNLKFLRYITMFVFFVVQMLTVPRWCLIDDNIKDKTWCDNDIYLNFDIPKISIYVSYPIEMACVIIVSATVLSKRMIRNLTVNERLREAIVLFVSATIIIEKSIILIVNGAPFICDFFKPLLQCGSLIKNYNCSIMSIIYLISVNIHTLSITFPYFKQDHYYYNISNPLFLYLNSNHLHLLKSKHK